MYKHILFVSAPQNVDFAHYDISSYCKMCTLPTLRSRMFVCCEQYKHARSYCWQWTHFTMGPNEQNLHFAELRQKICLYIHVVVLLTCLPSLDGKLERFVTKKWQKWLPNSSQTDYSDHSTIQAPVVFNRSLLFFGLHFTCLLFFSCFFLSPVFLLFF